MLNSFLVQYGLSYFFGGLVFAFLAIFVFIKSPRERLNQVFSAYCFAVAWWSFFSILMINAPNEFLGIMWDRLCLIGVILLPPLFVHFNYILLGYYRKYRWFVLANYFISGFFLLTNFTSSFVSHVSPKFGLNYYTDPGVFYLPFVVYFFALSIFTISVLFYTQKTVPVNKKKQISLLFWACFIGYSVGGSNYNLSFGIGPAYLALIGNVGVVGYALVVAYTITKHRLLDIFVIISRTVAEALAILFHGLIYISLVYLYRASVSPRIDLPFIIWTVIYGVIVGQTHQTLRLFLQTTSDKLFLRGKYDYYKALSDASSKVGEKLSLDHVMTVLYNTFSEVIEIANPRIFLLEENDFIEHKSKQGIPLDSPLVKELIAKRELLFDRKDFDAALIVPCLVEERLIAIIVLGQKLSEDAYTDEDLKLFKVLANQVAITLDHAHSYEKIKADLEIAGHQLERSRRLASLGTLTAGVTHEIRNPLTVIRAEAERIANGERSLEDLQKFRDIVLKHIDRIAGIVQRMLSLAKEKPKQVTEVNLNELIETTFLCFSLQNIACHKELGPIKTIKGDQIELQEVLVNLIQNAIEAMPNGGKLTVKSYMEEGRVAIEVIDTGKGIPEEIKEKIFDPFYSTRHEGTGLGLSIVYRIVREHGGDIKVESEVGKGTTFKLLF